jgi:tRNA(fMet)-specific endonuclease VapC
MNGSYLLDTNIVIALFQREAAVQERLAAADVVFIPTIVLGELYFGAWKSSRAEENTVLVDEFASGRSILGCDRHVAREYGLIKTRLREKGRPLPENDIWIAAIAREHGLILITRDSHFQDVEDLKWERW